MYRVFEYKIVLALNFSIIKVAKHGYANLLCTEWLLPWTPIFQFFTYRVDPSQRPGGKSKFQATYSLAIYHFKDLMS